MQAEITGTVFPVLQLQLQPGEVIVAETGQLAWMTQNIALQTTTQTGGVGGFLGAVGRAFAGGGLFMTEFQATDGTGGLAFNAHLPGQIIAVEVPPGRSYMAHKHGFLCGTRGVTLSAGFQQSFSAGLFGGAGFILQRITGPGTAWIELGGDIVPYDLPPGGMIRVHPGLVGMFEDSVTFSLNRIRGVRNVLFGGDLFLAELTGPGRVWLQTLAIANLAHAIEPYLRKEPVGQDNGRFS